MSELRLRIAESNLRFSCRSVESTNFRMISEMARLHGAKLKFQFFGPVWLYEPRGELKPFLITSKFSVVV